MLRLVILLLASGCVTLCSHIYREYYLINQPKKWDDAQSYCRENYIDLATVSSNDEMKRLVEITAASGVRADIWIGLKKMENGEWKWSDNNDSSFRSWHPSQPNHGDCTLYKPSTKRWYDWSCTGSLPFLCYNVRVTRQIIRVEMKSNSFVNFRDSAVSESILNQIQNKYEGVKLQWRVQPDGTIFHKKKKAPMKPVKAVVQCQT